MVVDAPGPSSLVPSSQPDAQAAFRPGSQARIDDLPPPPIPRSAPPAIAALLEDRAKWGEADASTFSSASRTELTSLPPHSAAHVRAFQLGIDLQTLIQSLPNA